MMFLLPFSLFVAGVAAFLYLLFCITMEAVIAERVGK